MGATESECKKLAAILEKAHPAIVFNVESVFGEDETFYISVISSNFQRPDLSRLLPKGWKASDWVCPDQRADTCAVHKVRKGG